MYTIEFECVLSGRYWRQWADERFGDLPPKVGPGAFGGQIRMEGPSGSALLLCV